MYPTISEYIEAIMSAEDNFKELTNLRPVLGDDGQPVMTSGNFAVVFKMQDIETSKFYALKCFIKEQEGREEAYHQIAEELKNVDSPYLVSINYLEKEFFVDTKQTGETEFPVLLMDWVEGKTLDKFLRKNLDDKYALEMLAYRFSQLAQWLIPQPFAHGDLKPDNILVREDGTLVLVDYDGMYVPAMKGQRARELGSPDFRHPQRTEDDFDEHIDDFPIVSILLSLKAISINPQLLEEYGAADRLLLSKADYHNTSGSMFLKSLFPSDDIELNRIVGILMIALSEKDLSKASIQLLLTKPVEIISTIISEHDLGNEWIDRYGAKYSQDGMYLLEIPNNLLEYVVLEGTRIIGDRAFSESSIKHVVIPNTVTHIGKEAFAYCHSLSQCFLPNSITYVGDEAFWGCDELIEIIIPYAVDYIGKNPFGDCRKLHTIICKSENFIFQKGLLYSCDMRTIISCINYNETYDDDRTIIPNTVTHIGDSAFAGLYISEINLPESITHIGEFAFAHCPLYNVRFSNSIIYIGASAFLECYCLSHINIPRSVTFIGDDAFSGCLLKQVIIPDSVRHIGDYAFSFNPLSQITIPNSVTEINDSVFYSCKLKQIIIPTGSRSKFEKMLPKHKDILVEK